MKNSLSLVLAIFCLTVITSCDRKRNITYERGPRGGCYSVSSSGQREYVDNSLCDKAEASTITEAQKEELATYRKIFLDDYTKNSKCKIVTLDGAIEGSNYKFQAATSCAYMNDLYAVVYNAHLPSGEAIKVLEYTIYGPDYRSRTRRVFVNSAYLVIDALER